jgi:hypothetical protein
MAKRTIIKGIFVQNYFLHGFEIENASKLKRYMKFENIKIISVSGVSSKKSPFARYRA